MKIVDEGMVMYDAVDKDKFQTPPQMPGGVAPLYGRIPTAMTKKSPFANSKIILFNVPIANYNVTTGSINSVFAKGINTITKNMEKWFDTTGNKETKKIFV